MIATVIGGVPVYTYGLLLLAAILVGTAAAWVNTRLHGESFAPVVDMLLWGIPLAAVCGHAGYVLSHFSEYSGDLLGVICLWQGGVSFYGSIFGGLLAVFGVCRVHGLDTWYWLDLLVPAFVLMIAAYEFGMFNLQQTLGMPLPRAVPNDHAIMEYVEYDYRPDGFKDNLYFQPIALYQSGMQFAVFVLMVLLTAVQALIHRPRQAGCLFLLGASLIAFVRCACGFFYLSSSPQSLIPLGRALSGGLGIVLLAWFLLRCRRSHTSFS